MTAPLRNSLVYLLVSVGLFVSAHLLYHSALMRPGATGNLTSFSKILHEKEKHTEVLLNGLADRVAHRPIRREFKKIWGEYVELYDNDGIALFGFENDTLRFWNTHKVPVPAVHDGQLDRRIVSLQNGLYDVLHVEKEGKHWYGLVMIKHDYPFENDYLVNDFQNDFNMSRGGQLSLDVEGAASVVTGYDGAQLFSISFSDDERPAGWKFFLLVLMNVVAVLCLFLALHMLTLRLSKRIGRFWGTLIFVSVIIGLRVLSITGIQFGNGMELTTLIPEGFPMVFGDLDLFSPAYYADSALLPSLGDLLINTLLFLFLTWYLHRQFRTKRPVRLPPGFPAFFEVLVGLLVLHGFALLFNGVVQGLITNSSINFEVNNLFSLDWYSYVGILIICMLFLAYFILANRLIESMRRSGITGRQFILLFGTLTVAYVIVNHLVGNKDLILVLWSTAAISTIAYTHYRKEARYEFSTVILLIGIFSFFSSHALAKYTIQKEKENRLVFAEKLSSDEDPVAEWEYPSLERKLMRDALVSLPFDTLNQFSKSKFEITVQQQFFTGYWEKYEVSTYIFGPDSIELGVTTPGREQFKRLERTINIFGSQSELSPNLHYVHNANEKLSYIIKLPLLGLYHERPYGFLYFELTSKLIPEELGFPALLLGKNTRQVDDLSSYSYGRYVDGRLVTPSSGDYPYPLSLSIFEAIKGPGPFHDFDGYNHLFDNVDERTWIILSKPEESILGQFTAFSYLFAFFSILILLVIFFRNFPQGLRIEQLQLKTKIQLLIVLVLLTSLILFVMGTRYYIEQQYQEKNRNLISEKISSVQIEVHNKLGKQPVLNASLTEEMTKYLKKFSRVFFTDINLYSLDGELLASSRGKIFDEGLISRQMSPEAYVEIGLNEKSKFLFEEEIGSMRYLSVYVPFRNNNNQILAYLNLPYFAKQDELESEISSFLVAIINIFVLLFGFSIVAALFVSNWITKPLRQLQESLSNIRLGQSNQTIEYKGSDEIGSLVAEYNKMVNELEYNTMLLARSERETAWREMAKQVAHEIKNPLTPIKLRAQHMQMSFDPNHPKSEERMKNFTAMLIEQIDTLTTIANEFSNFAKMPKAREEKLDLVHLLESSVELYKDVEEAEVHYESNLAGPEYIMADKDQMVRIFNNLVKNAIQAIPENEEGKVKVILTVDVDGYKVEVKDNGSGIPAELQERIFQPNFTTKGTGMGLGLAMVKQIVENADGKVWFETRVGRGTSFYVSLPIYDDGEA